MNCKNKLFMTKKKAFTLIELLIVIAIIGILFIVLVSKVDFATDKAKASGVQTDFRSFQMAFDTVAREQSGFSELVDEDYEQLEMAINKNLDNKLKIDIDADGTITMANGATDPWNVEYHGKVVVGQDSKDRGAVIVYSNGPDMQFGSNATIVDGVVSITVNDAGKDDYAIVSCYTYVNGYGEVLNITTGFSNNQNLLANGSAPTIVPGDGTNDDNEPSPGLGGYQMLAAPSNITASAGTIFRSEADINLFKEVRIDGNIVPQTAYSVRSGSTIVTFFGEYLDSLSNGEHEMEIVALNGGSAKSTFSVNISCRNHIDEDWDQYCDACNIVYCYETVCKNENDDCFCDYCGWTSYEGEIWQPNGGEAWHIDANQDSYCDKCNGIYCCDGGPCIDLNGDCICEGCGWEQYWDENLDGYCDGCGIVYCYDSKIHRDNDKNGSCDFCFEKMCDLGYNHIDDDHSHFCDSCETWMQSCIAEPGERCSICGEYPCYYAICEDMNGDDHCDYCGNFDCRWSGCVVGNDCRCMGCGMYMHIDNNKDSFCDTCSVAVGCEFGGQCKPDANSNCQCVYCWCEAHDYKDNICIYCNSFICDYYDCVDLAPHNCTCDICDDYVLSCYDSNKDGRCDIDGRYMCSTTCCMSNDDDCLCDYCGSEGWHWDGKDGNGYCDRCGVVYCQQGQCHDNDGNGVCDWCGW